MGRKIKIAFRWLGILLLLLILCLIAAYFLLQNPKVQTKLVHYFTNQLSEDLNTRVEVGDVDFDFFSAVTINNIFIEDLQGDTLLFAGKIHTDALVFQPFKQQFVFTNTQMHDLKVRLRRSPGDSLTNLDHLLASKKSNSKKKEKPKKENKNLLSLAFNDIDIQNFDFLVRDSLKNKATDFRMDSMEMDFQNFDLEEKNIQVKYIRANQPFISLVNTDARERNRQDTTKFALPKGWKFGLEELKLKDGQFINRGSPKKIGKENVFAFSNYNWRDFNLEAKNVKAEEGQLDLDIDKLSFVDETGFRVDHLSGHGYIHADDIVVQDLDVVLDQSKIRGNLKMNYNQFEHFSEFEDKIYLDASINQIRLMPREFRLLFGSDILKEPVFLSGDLQGNLNNLSTQNFNLEYQNGAIVKGDIDARGLPDLENTFFDARIEELAFTQFGLQQIMGKKEVPEQVRRFGNLSYQGEFLGYISDLIINGGLVTDIGNFDVDVKYTTDQNGNPKYSGFLASNDFNVGYWLDNPDLGMIDFSGSIAGTNFDLNTMNADFDARINSVDYLGNTINNLDFDASLAGRVLSAKGNIDDEIFTGFVDAELDYSSPVAKTKIKTNVEKGDLYALGITDTQFSISGQFNADLTGNSVSELQGEIEANNTNVSTNGKQYDLGNLGLLIEEQEGQQVLAFNSDNASAKFIGNYNYTQLVPTVLQTINAYYDFEQGWESLDNTVTSNEEIGFQLEIAPNDELIKLILPELEINSGINADGLLNPATDEISVLALADSLAYKNYSIIDWTLDAYGDGTTLSINSFQDNIQNKGKNWLTDSDLNIELSRDDIFVDVRTYNDKFLAAKISSRIQREGDEFKISILSSDLIVDGEEWEVEEGNSVTVGGDSWEAENFVLHNGDQRIKIYNPPGQEETKLVANLEEINLTTINSLVGFTNKPLDGRINGDVDVVELNTGLNLDISLVVSDLMYNNDVLESTVLEGLFNFGTQKGKFEGITTDDDFQFVIDSELDLNKESDMLVLNIDIIRSSISPFGNLWASSLSDVQGYIDGNMQIVGGPTKFNLAGEINVIEDILLTLKFSQARYKMPAGQTLAIERDGFLLQNLKLTDPYNQEATINGKILHNDLTNFTLDVGGQFENFLFLNTSPRDNESFYGTAFATGDLAFTGPVDDALLLVNATSDENTQIFIQASSGQNTGTYSFLRFRTPEVDTVEIVQKDQSRLSMEFDLDIEPNAEVNMYFDGEGFNSLRGNGYGDLFIALNTDDATGSLAITGIYEVNQGAYVVNFKDIFTRDFDILPGGLVQWAGDPFNANLDINARYRLEADVSALSSNQNNARYLANAKTDLNVNITGKLSNPQFDYNIALDRAQAGTEINDQIQVINSDPTKLDNQIGSLLLLKRFSNLNSDPFSNSEAGSIALNSVTDILASQLSSLLSETGILENTNINFDYENYQDLVDEGQLGDLGYDQSLQIQLSSRIFNDRIEIEYGGDFNFGDGLDNQVNTFEVGDFVLTYNLSESGNYKFRLFSRRDYSVIHQEERRRNGFGFLIKKDFNKLSELFEKEEKPEQENPENLPPEMQPAIEPEEEEGDSQ